MTNFYDDMATVALELLTEFGQSATLERRTGGTHNPVTGAVTGASDDPQTVKAVFADYNRLEAGKSFEDGTQVQRGDKKVIIAASGLSWAPDLNTVINDEWSIVNIKEISPAGTPLIYECQARK